MSITDDFDLIQIISKERNFPKNIPPPPLTHQLVQLAHSLATKTAIVTPLSAARAVVASLRGVDPPLVARLEKLCQSAAVADERGGVLQEAAALRELLNSKDSVAALFGK